MQNQFNTLMVITQIRRIYTCIHKPQRSYEKKNILLTRTSTKRLLPRLCTKASPGDRTISSEVTGLEVNKSIK